MSAAPQTSHKKIPKNRKKEKHNFTCYIKLPKTTSVSHLPRGLYGGKWPRPGMNFQLLLKQVELLALHSPWPEGWWAKGEERELTGPHMGRSPHSKAETMSLPAWLPKNRPLTAEVTTVQGYAAGTDWGPQPEGRRQQENSWMRNVITDSFVNWWHRTLISWWCWPLSANCPRSGDSSTSL